MNSFAFLIISIHAHLLIGICWSKITDNRSKAWIKTCRVFKTRQVWNEPQRFRPLPSDIY
jgi:hypothetical protein